MAYRERDVEFEHIVHAWTVGDLRRALEGVPDDTELVIDPAEEPGGQVAGPQQVVVAAAMGQDWVPPERRSGERDGHWVPADRFEIETEFPSGTYHKTVTDDDADGW